MKVKVKTELRTENQILKKDMVGIFHHHKLQFLEDRVKVTIDFLEHLMIREDDEKKLSYKFLENEETLNELFLYDMKSSVSIPIFTKCFSYRDSFFEVCYHLPLENNDVCYQVCWEELK